MGARLRRPGIFQIPEDAEVPSCMSSSCTQSAPVPIPDSSLGGSTWRMETYYYRKNHTYVEAPCCKPRIAWPSHPKVSRLLFYGDSTVKNSWELITYPARTPCRVTKWRPRMIHSLFTDGHHSCIPVGSVAEIDPKLDVILKRCTAGAPWTSVPVGTDNRDVSKCVVQQYIYF